MGDKRIFGKPPNPSRLFPFISNLKNHKLENLGRAIWQPGLQYKFLSQLG
ncbi:hypothetical protein A33Q_1472 [Indibacter alkaliphilus LW1]|uniref:Uncharacterized protein n=1 Tax=Indibacter alkaliphilus (strain CCUG 57479 / KCTC 22604 / LW1) TaxID=1189612 RepID=S2DLP9_INDAL|nr:hypothetical protein A33Q_1472 [Indibacter alkaliphilus LW1]